MKFSLKNSVKSNKTNDTAVTINKNVHVSIAKIKNDFGDSSDLKVSYITFDSNKESVCANLYLQSLVDRNSINSLSSELAKLKCECGKKNPEESFDTLIKCLSGLRAVKEGCDYETLSLELLSGSTIFLMDGFNKFFSIAAASDAGRSIDEPTSQTIIRGPKEGFTEKQNSNILLIRKRIKSKALRVENMFIGSVTKTQVSLMYIDKIAKDEIVQELRKRLNGIRIDGILDSGYIEELIKDDRYSIFPAFLSSEKPDSVAAALLEGKVAILVDGSPYVLTVPVLMFDFFQASEDYYHNFIVSSMMRFLRFVAFFLTLLVPSIYIAVITFHQEILPTPLLLSIAAQREGVPFPALIEVLIMEITFEILREAGIRMPRAIGPAISIVGALVLGQAAVEAGIVSAVMVIIVSITAISSFAIPNYEMSNAIRTIRFILIFLSGLLGLYGIFMGLIIMTLHLCKLKSISVPYLSSVAPKIKGGNKDTILRFPLWNLKYRPAGISSIDTARVSDDQTVSTKGKPELR